MFCIWQFKLYSRLYLKQRRLVLKLDVFVISLKQTLDEHSTVCLRYFRDMRICVQHSDFSSYDPDMVGALDIVDHGKPTLTIVWLMHKSDDYHHACLLYLPVLSFS